MAGKFLKYAIEAGFGIKSTVKGNAQQGIILVFGVGKPCFYLLHPVAVHEIEETHAQLLIDYLRKMIYGNIHVFGNLCQTQLSV